MSACESFHAYEVKARLNAPLQGVYMIMAGLDVERLVFTGGPMGILQVRGLLQLSSSV